MIRKRLFRSIFMNAMAIISISVLVATGCKSPGKPSSESANSEPGKSSEASSAIVPTIERLDRSST